MDSNSHLGKDILKDDPNDQNTNGKLFCEFLNRMPHLTVVNTLPICEGVITRMRKTTRGVEKSILDVFVTCQQILPFVKRMTIDENHEHALTNYSTVKNQGRVIESDHNVETLEVDLVFNNVKQERIHIYDFKNRDAQMTFKGLTSNTNEFSKCFDNNLNFEEQTTKWRNVLEDFFHKSFKKIRITNKTKKKKSEIHDLMDRRSKLKKKENLKEDDEQDILDIEIKIAEKCQDENRKKVIENFWVDGW